MTLDLKAVVNVGYQLDLLGSGAIVPGKDRTVSLVIPAPSVLDIQVADQPILTGVLTQQDRDLQIRLKKEAQTLLRTQALSGDIMTQAKNNIVAAFTSLFSGSNLTLQEVRVAE